MAIDKNAFEHLKRTVSEMDVLNSAVEDSFDLSSARVLEPVLGEIEFEELGLHTKAKLKDLVANYLEHVRSALEYEMELKSQEIQKIKSHDR